MFLVVGQLKRKLEMLLVEGQVSASVSLGQVKGR